jgi:hypothetical protein
MTSYSNDPRLTYRIKYIQNERKPVSTNMAGSVPNKTSIPKVEGTKGTEAKVSNPTLSKPGSKPSATTTPPKGSKRN